MKWQLLIVVLGSTACGGKAVIDREGSGGASTTDVTVGTTTPTTTSPTQSLCDACLTASIDSAGVVANVEITEASGIAASRIHEDVFYVHNDSGGAPRFFAIDSAGNDLGSYVLDGAAAVDWEDIDVGPCGQDRPGSCVYIADIGDNAGTRGSLAIYRVPEPATIGPGGQSVFPETLVFAYPDGRHDAEALIVDPDDGTLYVVSKVASAPKLYRLDEGLRFIDTVYVGDVQIPTGTALVTGGNASASGVLLRTWTNVILYEQGDDIVTQLTNPGCAVAAPGELQGEAVAWRRDGGSYLTVAEGQNPPVYEMQCQRR